MLTTALQKKGHAVTVLTRHPSAAHHAQWDPDGPLEDWAPRLEGVDAVVNLAGASLARRWTPSYKRLIWKSRVTLTRTLVAAIRSVRRTPKTLISASAIGIYGSRGDEPLTEASAPGSGFLAALCQEWEREALVATSHSRVIFLRNGLVLDRDRGALPQMALPFYLFAGGPIGSGRQVVSWIHREDWVALACWALEHNAVSGPVNATTENPVTNLELARTLGRVLRRPSVMPAPALAVRLLLGEMADVVLTGQRVIPAKAREGGFEFRFPLIEDALRAEYENA